MYHYEGVCPATGTLLRLPRTPVAEQAARELVSALTMEEGKMFGVLLTECGRLLRAFSGQWRGGAEAPGWAPPLLKEDYTPAQQAVVDRLAEIKLEWLSPDDWEGRERELKARLSARKLDRDGRRAAGETVLEHESQRDSGEWRDFRRARRAALEAREALGKERRELSRALQRELMERFDRALFAGAPWSLASLFPRGAPTGTGDCCAPKLLYQAARLGLRPAAMAEIWWGPATNTRQTGEFYAACAERCQPLLGPLLSWRPLTVLYEDDHILAVDKPVGVLTVPGRSGNGQDCLLRRVADGWRPVHRLDLETSGVVLLARHRAAQAHLQQQFARGEVRKRYQALVDGETGAGEIGLPLARDPGRPGRYCPAADGKPALTRYRQLEEGRLLLEPQTGRSHQLRVHLSAGLGLPIRGDRLYGGSPAYRLMLHAWQLEATHPVTGQELAIEAPLPF